MSDEQQREPRTGAEWVTFGVSLAILAVVVVLIGLEAADSEKPPLPIAKQAGRVREEGGQFYVPVQVVNKGDATAENVQVTAELTIEGETAEADQVVDFLAGGETEDVEFVFDDDPEDGELKVQVSGFLVP